jgi:DNA-directed RNA polymerase subunit RPC12/RpoP
MSKDTSLDFSGAATHELVHYGGSIGYASYQCAKCGKKFDVAGDEKPERESMGECKDSKAPTP